MAPTDPGQKLSFALSDQETGQKQNGQDLSVPAQSLALVAVLGLLSSVALSPARVLPVYHLFSATLQPGDISILH